MTEFPRPPRAAFAIGPTERDGDRLVVAFRIRVWSLAFAWWWARCVAIVAREAGEIAWSLAFARFAMSPWLPDRDDEL